MGRHGGLLLLITGLAGCPSQQLVCEGSGGDWNDCRGYLAVCVDGRVERPVEPAICQRGCDCPTEAPVWDDERGCLREAECTEPG